MWTVAAADGDVLKLLKSIFIFPPYFAVLSSVKINVERLLVGIFVYIRFL